MSKQYLATHKIDNAHVGDVFSLAVTPQQVILGGSVSVLKVHSTTEPEFPLVQELKGSHNLGCHHIATSKNGKRAASVGFDGSVALWTAEKVGSEGTWVQECDRGLGSKETAGEGIQRAPAKAESSRQIWAIALSENGQYLAGTTPDGHINVWDCHDEREQNMIREYETKGSFGLCVDISVDGRFTASGHQNGEIYIFNNDTHRMAHFFQGIQLPIRTVAFSPGVKILAAAGSAGVIALYDISSGDQVANLTGHNSWIMSLDWSDTGEYILSGAHDGKAKVWSVDLKDCVATHTDTEKTLWCVKWLPKVSRSEGFATAGANKSISFYREATGGQ